MGAFYQFILGMENIALLQGVKIYTNSAVSQINIIENEVKSIIVDEQEILVDAVIGASDYHHVESLFPTNYRNYSESYWSNRTFAPSFLIYYLGFKE